MADTKKPEISLKNILSYTEGNLKFIFDKFGLFPQHKKEQVLWRLYKCKDTCIPDGACQYCGCKPHRKAFVNKSCNNEEIFPDMLNEQQWEEYKKIHKIDLDGFIL